MRGVQWLAVTPTLYQCSPLSRKVHHWHGSCSVATSCRLFLLGNAWLSILVAGVVPSTMTSTAVFVIVCVIRFMFLYLNNLRRCSHFHYSGEGHFYFRYVFVCDYIMRNSPILIFLFKLQNNSCYLRRLFLEILLEGFHHSLIVFRCFGIW